MPVTIGLRDVVLAAREIYAVIYPHLALKGDNYPRDYRVKRCDAGS